MAEKHEVEILISPEGFLRYRIKGIRGPSCRRVVEGIERQVGPSTETERTSEYYLEPEVRTKGKVNDAGR